MTFQDQQLNSMTFLVVSDLYEPCSVGLLALNQGTLVSSMKKALSRTCSKKHSSQPSAQNKMM